MYKDKGNVQKASSYWAQAIIQGADFPEPYYNLAGILWTNGEIDKARQMFDKSISIDPMHLKSYLNAAGMLGEAGEWNEAKSYLQRALEISQSPQDHDKITQLIKQIENLQKNAKAP